MCQCTFCPWIQSSSVHLIWHSKNIQRQTLRLTLNVQKCTSAITQQQHSLTVKQFSIINRDSRVLSGWAINSRPSDVWVVFVCESSWVHYVIRHGHRNCRVLSSNNTCAPPLTQGRRSKAWFYLMTSSFSGCESSVCRVPCVPWDVQECNTENPHTHPHWWFSQPTWISMSVI